MGGLADRPGIHAGRLSRRSFLPPLASMLEMCAGARHGVWFLATPNGRHPAARHAGILPARDPGRDGHTIRNADAYLIA